MTTLIKTTLPEETRKSGLELLAEVEKISEKAAKQAQKVKLALERL